MSFEAVKTLRTLGTERTKDGLRREVVVPDGDVKSKSGDFTLDAEGAAAVIAEFQGRQCKMVIDYDHHTVGGEYASPDGTAKAAGWIERLSYEPGVGLIAEFHFTKSAEQMVQAEEYKYFSPVTAVDKKTRRVVGLYNVGLTNTPAIQGMQAIAASSDLRSYLSNLEIKAMSDSPASGAQASETTSGTSGAMAAAEGVLGSLPAGITAEEVIEKLLAKIKELQGKLADSSSGGDGDGDKSPSEAVAGSARTALGLAVDADSQTVVNAIETIKGHLGYVPLADHAVVANRLTALENAEKGRVAEALVQRLVAAHKINKFDSKRMEWARNFAAKDPANFELLMNDAPAIVPTGATTAPKDGVGGGRTTVIANAAAAWDGDRGAQIASKEVFVNGALVEARQAELSKDEIANL